MYSQISLETSISQEICPLQLRFTAKNTTYYSLLLYPANNSDICGDVCFISDIDHLGFLLLWLENS